jgi:hypothetical protein
MTRLRIAGPAALVALTALGAPLDAAAQDSQFGVRGPGTPGRTESARARGTAGAFAAFDALSPLTAAALADLRRFTAATEAVSSYRHVDLAGASANLRGTRFPALVVGGPPVGTGRLVVSAGYSTYLDKTYRTSVRDSLVLRGVQQPYTDVIASDGGVSDLRLAAAWRVSSRLAVGGGLHLLTGAARASAQRRFDDSVSYRNTFERADVEHSGAGVSVSALVDVTSALRLAAWYRGDSRLVVSVRDVEVARFDLPVSFGAAARLVASPRARLAATAERRSWADAGGTNTLTWAVGFEGGSAGVPVRLGVRGGDLPFGGAAPGASPRELAFAAGFGRSLSSGRARIDLALERATRSGGDLRETIWSLVLGFTVQP